MSPLQLELGVFLAEELVAELQRQAPPGTPAIDDETKIYVMHYATAFIECLSDAARTALMESTPRLLLRELVAEPFARERIKEFASR